MAIVTTKFYSGGTVETAKALLGKYLVRQLNGELLVGRITETEAYIGRCDKACHAYNGRRTARTEVMFGPPGRAYVYLIYGMYHCLNLVTEPEGEAAAVLLRGLSPVSGLETMCRLRYGDRPVDRRRMQGLLNGPGKLCQGLGITRAENGLSLDGPSLLVCDSPADVGLPVPAIPRERMTCGRRIGIEYAQEDRELPWRFWLEKEQ